LKNECEKCETKNVASLLFARDLLQTNNKKPFLLKKLSMSFETIQVSSSKENFLLDLVETATRKYAEGHEIVQVVDNTIWTNGTEFRTGVVLYSTEKQRETTQIPLLHKVMYSSRFDSSIDFYTQVQKALNELYSSHHKIHCLSIDSYPERNPYGIVIYTQSYCLILYTHDSQTVVHKVSTKIVIANDNQSYTDIVENLNQIMQRLDEKGHKLLSIGTDSLQEGVIARETTVGWIFYAKQITRENRARAHLQVHKVAYESRQSYNELLNWVVKEVNQIDTLISVNVDAFVMPGKNRRTYLGLAHVGPPVPITLVAVLSYYL
jgi:hypothetical protein